MSRRAWIHRPAMALVQAVIVTVVVVAAVGASCAVLLGLAIVP